MYLVDVSALLPDVGHRTKGFEDTLLHDRVAQRMLLEVRDEGMDVAWRCPLFGGLLLIQLLTSHFGANALAHQRQQLLDGLLRITAIILVERLCLAENLDKRIDVADLVAGGELAKRTLEFVDVVDGVHQVPESVLNSKVVKQTGGCSCLLQTAFEQCMCLADRILLFLVLHIVPAKRIICILSLWLLDCHDVLEEGVLVYGVTVVEPMVKTFPCFCVGQILRCHILLLESACVVDLQVLHEVTDTILLEVGVALGNALDVLCLHFARLLIDVGVRFEGTVGDQ